MTLHTDIPKARRSIRGCIAALAAAIVILGTATAPALADHDRDRNHHRKHWHHECCRRIYTGGYYTAPPVVYSQPVYQPYYAPPPVVYQPVEPEPGINLNFHIR